MSTNVAAISFILGLLKALKTLKSWQKQDEWSVVNYFEKVYAKRKKKPLFVYVDENRTLTYQEFEDLSSKFAAFAKDVLGVTPGTCVSLVKTNSPEFVVVWYGLAKCGAKTALVNHNLTGFPLANCLKLAAEESKPKDGAAKRNVVIYSSDVEKNIMDQEVLAALAEKGNMFEFWSYDGSAVGSPVPAVEGHGHSSQSLDDALNSFERSLSNEESSEMRQGVRGTDILLYIYTSGTTGLPKAAKISHIRFAFAGVSAGIVFKYKPSDRIYCALPIYHSAAGMLGLSVTWEMGATFILRKKFSASSFFKDCAQYKCTVVQYIGELLRYINASPPSEWDTKHKVRMAMGNGLRKSVWIEFVKRFKVPKIAEFYGATEGNATLINPVNKPGAVGFLPKLVRLVYPVKLIRIDPEDEETPIRGKNGFCLETRSGEVGHLIGLIKDDDPSRRFDGYTNQAANEKKILRDVFKKGDRWFATGDLLKREGPYVYFVDRIGDTFRWKGENCSTREIEEVITAGDKDEIIEEVNVYGAQIEGQDGRAGMAYFRLKNNGTVDSFDFKTFYDYTEKTLASYQRPLFLRFTEGSFELTSTFKHTKVALRKQGFDPSQTSDPLYFRNPETKSYTLIDANLYSEIQTGKFKL